MKDSLEKISLAKKNLAKLRLMSGSSELQALSFSGSTRLDNLPDIWCPQVNKQVRFDEIPDLSSDKIINISGGTPWNFNLDYELLYKKEIKWQ